MKLEEKINDTVRVILVGHVDHGKSTLIGRMIYDLDQIKDGKYQELKETSKKRGMSFEWAFLTDALQTERNQGITIDTSQILLKSEKRNYILVDAPGHIEFLKNMITGASNAEIAILLVDVIEGVKEQTKKHAQILQLLGFSDIIILINKMDKINYEEEKFKKVKRSIKELFNKLNLNSKFIVPISAKNGDNINKKSQKMPWYNDNSVIKILDSLEYKENLDQKYLRLVVQDVYKKLDKRIVVGKIHTGELKKGDQIVLSPSESSTKIKCFEDWPDNSRDKAKSGECVSFTLEDETFVQRGEIISKSENSPKLLSCFEGNIFWLDNTDVDQKKKYEIKIGTGTYFVKFEEIKQVYGIDKKPKRIKKNITKNDIARVVLSSNSLMPADSFSENNFTGRFSILKDHRVVGGGIISSNDYPNQRKTKNRQLKNITPINLSVTEIDRLTKYGHRSGIIWLTGLSGSGKSTLAKGIEKKLFHKGYNIYVLDGDNLRNGLNKDLGFSADDRMENIRRTSEVASLFSFAGFIVIASLISPYRSERKKARAIRPEIFKEVYVKASLDTCIKRDVKGLYAKALSGKIKNFTGLSSPYEEPQTPDLILNTDSLEISQTLDKLENFILKHFGIVKKNY